MQAPVIIRPTSPHAHLPAPATGSGHGIWTYLLSRAAAAQLAGFLLTEGARLQVRAEARARGGTGSEHLAR